MLFADQHFSNAKSITLFYNHLFEKLAVNYVISNLYHGNTNYKRGTP